MKPNRSTWPAIFGLLLLFGPPARSADKADKADKQWPDTVRALILPEEEKTYKALKDAADRKEFQKIFWARRDPDLETPENEFQLTEFEPRKAEADKRFAGIRGPGSTTDCGRVFILLGEPDSVQKQQEDAPTMPMPGQRHPENWTYRDKPGQTIKGGQVVISFGPSCDVPHAFQEDLRRIAEIKIVRPDLAYRFDSSRRLVKLEDLLPKPSPAQTLLKTPREDFPVAVRVLYLKEGSGGTVLFGVVRGEASGLTVEQSGANKTVRVVLAARTVGENGKAAGFAEQAIVAPVRADGSFAGVFKIGMKPGKYTLSAGALDDKSGKGALSSQPIEVPDLNKGELSMGSVLLLSDVEDLKPDAAVDRTHPFGAFQVGNTLLHAFPPGPLPKSASLTIFYQLYDLRVDEATGKADTTVSLDITKAGKPVAKASAASFETPVAGQAIGPIDLAGFEPGQYAVRLKIRDNVAKINKTEETPFELAP